MKVYKRNRKVRKEIKTSQTTHTSGLSVWIKRQTNKKKKTKKKKSLNRSLANGASTRLRPFTSRQAMVCRKCDVT